MVDLGFLLEGSHEARGHQRVRAVNPDDTQGLGAVLRLMDHAHGLHGRVGLVHPPRRALLFLRPPLVGLESGQKLLVSV